jgi:predicted transcriptional regulator YheO
VSIIETAIIALLCLNLGFSIWQTRIIGLAIQKLDSNIAQALPIVIQEAVKELNLSDVVEPVNPIMQIIADSIGKSIQGPSLEVKEISRAEDGKFT